VVHPVQPQILPGTEISRFRVESLIARGGMGVVYRALDHRLERPVALKLLAPELSDNARFRDRFVRESRLAAAVDHPNIIPIYEADEWNGLLYIAMRFVRGVDLHTAVVTDGPVDIDVALRVLSQAASALDAAHAVGLVHRDVKPGNMLVASSDTGRGRADGHVYLTDFGLTKRSTSLTGFTTVGHLLGTLDYVAPEQIRGEEVDARTDLYALTCVAFEMLAGDPPFVREQDSAILWAHMNDDPPSVSAVRTDLPAALDAVIARGMAKEPEERQESCGDLVAQMAEAVGADGGVGLIPGRDTSSRRPDEPFRGSVRPPVSAPGDAAPTPGGHETPRPTPDVPPPPIDDTPPVDTARPPSHRRQAVAAASRIPGPRRLVWWAVAAALLLVAAMVLVVWRPWAGGRDLVARELGVGGLAADVPGGWEPWPGDGNHSVLAPIDWSGVFDDDPSAQQEAATAAERDPESVVGLYAAEESDLNATSGEVLLEQIEVFLAGSHIDPLEDSIQVAGREAGVFTGTLRLAEGQLLHLHVRLVEGPSAGLPPVLLVFFAPAHVDHEWQPVFEQVTESIRPAG
jgi:serine/threonine protein kinase